MIIWQNQPNPSEQNRTVSPLIKTQTHTAALLAREGALVSAARGAQSGWSLGLRSESQTEPGPPRSASSWKQEVTSQPTSQSQTPTAAGFTKRLQVLGSPSEPARTRGSSEVLESETFWETAEAGSDPVRFTSSDPPVPLTLGAFYTDTQTSEH